MAYNPLPSVPNRAFNSSVEDLLSGRNSGQTRAQQLAELEGRGYQIQGTNAVNYSKHGRLSIPNYTPIDSLIGPSGQGALPGDPLLRTALTEDTRAMQGAADRQFARNNQQISGLDQFIGQMGGELRNVGQQGAGQLNNAAGQAMQMGNQQFDQMDQLLGGFKQQTDKDIDGVMQGVNDVQGRIKGTMDKQMPGYYKGLDNARDDVDEAYGLGNEAVAGYQQAIKDFKDTTAQDASVVAAAMKRDALSAKNDLTTAYQTGAIDDATYQSGLQQLKGRVGEQVQTQITGIYSQFNNAKVAMEQSLAGLRMNNASMRLTGSQIKSGIEGQRLQGIGTELSADQMLLEGENTKLGAAGLRQKSNMDIAGEFARAQEGQRQMSQLSSSLQQASVATSQAAVLNAVNLEMQGRSMMAGLVAQNPETVVSWFQGLLAMYAADSAQAAGFGAGSTGVMANSNRFNQGTGQQAAQSQQPAQFGQRGYVNPNSNNARSTGAFSKPAPATIGIRDTGWVGGQIADQMNSW